MIGQMHGAVDVSYLADCVILLRYFEAEGKIHKAISVMKKRSGAHEAAIRSFSMSNKGIEIGEALSKYRGVFSGIPNYEKTLGSRK
jgi:circadian clock protein KaiC